MKSTKIFKCYLDFRLNRDLDRISACLNNYKSFKFRAFGAPGTFKLIFTQNYALSVSHMHQDSLFYTKKHFHKGKKSWKQTN